MKLTKKGMLILIFIFVLSSVLNTTFLIWYSSYLLSSYIDRGKQYLLFDQINYKKHVLESLTSKGIDSKYNYISLLNNPRSEGIDSFFLDKNGEIIGSRSLPKKGFFIGTPSLSNNLQAKLSSIVSQLNERGIPSGYIVTKEKIPVYFELINDSSWLITLSFSARVETSYEVSHFKIVSIAYSVIVNMFIFMMLLFYFRNKAIYQVNLTEDFKVQIKKTK